MSQFMKESNVSDMDPTPMVTLASYDAKETKAAESVRVARNRKAGLADLKDKVGLLKPQGDLISLEVEKLNKVIGEQQRDGMDLEDRAQDFTAKVAQLRDEVEGKLKTQRPSIMTE